MTPIQELAFPAARRGDDVVARAQTGTGKTLAFLVPSLERLETDLNNRRPALVVLSPTRGISAADPRPGYEPACRLGAAVPARRGRHEQRAAICDACGAASTCSPLLVVFVIY